MNEAIQDYREIALASTGEGLFLVDSSGLVIYGNGQLWDLCGVKNSQIVGEPYQALFTRIAELSRDPQRVEQDLGAALTDLEQRPHIYVVLRQPQAIRLQVTLFALHAAQGWFTGWGGVIRDATGEWREIAQRTEQLSMLTRELRTPLAKIKGYVTTLLSSHQYWEESERQTFIESIFRGVEQLGQILEHAQQMFKLETGGIKLNRRATALKPLIDQCLSSLTLRMSGSHFKLEIPESLPDIEVDPDRVKQILNNLLDNAINCSPPDATIRISVRLDDEAILISVADRGFGVPEEHLARIFDPFYRIVAVNADRVADAGLGLFLARELTLAHQGRIWAESKVGEGTTITVVLPIRAQAAPAIELPATVVAQKFKGKPRGKLGRAPVKVLVAEDDPQMSRLLKMILEAERYQVISTAQGKAALELAISKKPDIVLLDMYLPDLNGLDVCTQLREVSNVPIVIVTVNSRPEDTARALDLGADDYLAKPFSQKELLARVRANLRRASNPDPIIDTPIFQTRDLVIDYDQRQVTVRGMQVRLTPTEYKLLCYLAVNGGRVLSHTQILAKVWGPEFQEDTQYLWVNISRLRKKLELDPANPEYVLTEPGVGYFLLAPADDSRAVMP